MRYNCVMTKQHNPQEYNTTYQLKLPVEISTIIEISDPVYTFCEVMDCIDLRKYLAVKESKTGRKRYNPLILLKVILFAFMEKGYIVMVWIYLLFLDFWDTRSWKQRGSMLRLLLK